MKMINQEVNRTKHTYLPARLIAMSFAMVILVGSVLLSLPIANTGTPAGYIDNLFTAVSATCVTGLVTLTTAKQFSFFGQVVIIVMIQIGGLGFITFLSLFLIKLRKKLTLTNKMVMQEALNHRSLTDLNSFLRKVIYFTFGVEGIGALLLATVFIPRYGFIKGSWFSIFHSISAFCNAGFDIIGSQSLVGFQSNLLVNLTISGLIISGGLGFIVWFDFLYKAKNCKKDHQKKFNFRKYLRSLTLQSKLVIIVTTVLLIGGTIAFFVLEYENSLQGLGLYKQVIISFFQSVTTRTAGFFTIAMGPLSSATKLMMSILMFIGGSPAGTAGGIKTVTIAIVFLMVRSIYGGRDEVTIYGRRLKKRLVIRAFALFMISLMVVFIAIFILSITEKALLEDIIFEVFSAFATVGLTAGLTPNLSVVGKIIIMTLMYIGRIGPISMLLSFARKSQLIKGKHVVYPDEDLMIG